MVLPGVVNGASEVVLSGVVVSASEEVLPGFAVDVASVIRVDVLYIVVDVCKLACSEVVLVRIVLGVARDRVSIVVEVNC